MPRPLSWLSGSELVDGVVVLEVVEVVDVDDVVVDWFGLNVNAAVVPLGVKREDFARAFPEICRFTNFHGALITMPHKIAVIGRIDEVSTAVKVAGSCNAVRRNAALLPAYTGPALTLYRGDSAWNRKRRTYGPSWSAAVELARSPACSSISQRRRARSGPS